MILGPQRMRPCFAIDMVPHLPPGPLIPRRGRRWGLLAGPAARGIGLSQDGAGRDAPRAWAASARAVADDPLSALFNNPAALADLGSRPQAQGGGDLGFLGGSFHNRANADASLDSVAGMGQVAASVPVGPLTFGAGVNPDLAARVSGRYTDAPGGADGATSYGNTRNTSETLLLRSAVGAGYRLAPNCFIGLTVGLLYNYNELRTNYVFQSQPALRGIKTGLDLDTSGLGYNFPGRLPLAGPCPACRSTPPTPTARRCRATASPPATPARSCATSASGPRRPILPTRRRSRTISRKWSTPAWRGSPGKG